MTSIGDGSVRDRFLIVECHALMLVLSDNIPETGAPGRGFFET